jgi:hypothetical protein
MHNYLPVGFEGQLNQEYMDLMPQGVQVTIGYMFEEHPKRKDQTDEEGSICFIFKTNRTKHINYKDQVHAWMKRNNMSKAPSPVMSETKELPHQQTAVLLHRNL